MLERLSVVVAALALLSGRSEAGVLVVAPQGQPYSQISSAVLAAQDGDVILVKSGVYSQVGLGTKSIAIVAEVGASVTVAGPINIANLPAGKTIVLDRVNADGSWGTAPTHALLIINCAGAIRVQQGSFTGGNGAVTIDSDCDLSGTADGKAAVRVFGSSDVAFAGCIVTGGWGAYVWDSDCHIQEDTVMVGGAGGIGLELSGASVTVAGSSVFGGGSGSGGYSEDAGDGAAVAALSRLVLTGSHFQGGNGGDSFDGIAPAHGGDGGRGVFVSGDSEVRLLDDELVGGLQGAGWGLAGGLPAAPLAGGGAVTSWSGEAASLDISELLREAQSTPVQVTGAPGDLVLLFLSLQTVSVAAPQAKGTFQLAPSSLLGPIVLGALGGSGQVTLSGTMPHLPAGLLSAEFYLQALLSGPGGLTLTSWSHVTVLDESL
jgi:hypothetical protein